MAFTTLGAMCGCTNAAMVRALRVEKDVKIATKSSGIEDVCLLKRMKRRKFDAAPRERRKSGH